MENTTEIQDIQFIIIDLFCGAGGTTTGFEKAQHENPALKLAKVIACVNHDPIAIKSHWANHPEVEHFEEDITTLYGQYHNGILFKSPDFLRLIRLVELYRAFYPNAKVILWASLECTNFSKAKGGLPRDADSRTLADHLDSYIQWLNPDYVQIENVVEFMSWGPLDAKGKPISKKNGQDWIRWRQYICSLGYRDEWKEMNSADYGALTSRNRLFGCFAKEGLPQVWPLPTHSKNPQKTSLVNPLQKWEPVKKALDFADEGNSVFNRKKALSTKTMQRLFMGCVKHIAGGKEHFITKFYSGKPQGKNISIEQPAGTITTSANQGLVKACFITKWNSNDKVNGGHPGHSLEDPSPVVSTQNRLGVVNAEFLINYNHKSDSADIDKPAPTVTTHDKLGKVQAHFIQKYYSNGGQHNSIEDPASALTTKDRLSKVSATFIDQQFSQGKQNQSVEEPLGALTTVPKSNVVQADFFIDKQFSGDDNHQSIEQPAGSILPNDKHNLVKAEKWLMNTHFNNVGSSLDDPAPVITADRHAHYIINPSWGGNSGSIEEPCFVVIARQDKAPLYVITCTEGPVSVPVYEGDCEWTIKLKEFMALYGICDIKMRMLKVPELKRIQGFPETYILHGNQTDQKKFIGNAVHPYVPEHWIKAFSMKLFPDSYLKKAA